MPMVSTFRNRIPPLAASPAASFALSASPMQDRAPAAGSFTTVAAPAARGQRLDRFLADAIGTLSRSRVKALIEQGLARSDGRVLSEPAEPVRPGATYVLDLPPPAPATPQPQAIPFTILYEDADLIVLDKPAGLVVHPAPGNQDGTLVNALLAHCGEQLTGIGGERRPGIVHRLDKDTSGIMVVAKTAAREHRADRRLRRARPRPRLPRAGLGPAQPARRRHRRRDRPRPARPQAHGGRRPQRQGRAHPLPHAARLAAPRSPCWNAGSPPGGRIRSACTSPAAATRWSAIRSTCAACPAVARTLPEPVRHRLLDFPRQALHAARLGFAHPRTGQPLSFTTDPPPDMAALIAALDRDLRPTQG